MCQASRSGIMLPSTLTHPLERKHPIVVCRPVSPTPLPFALLRSSFLVNLRFLLVVSSPEGNGQALFLSKSFTFFIELPRLCICVVISKTMRILRNYSHPLVNYGAFRRRELSNVYIYVTWGNDAQDTTLMIFLTQRVLRSYALTIAHTLTLILFYRGG